MFFERTSLSETYAMPIRLFPVSPSIVYPTASNVLTFKTHENHDFSSKITFQIFAKSVRGKWVWSLTSVDGVVHIDQVGRFGIFLKSASRLVPDGWVGLKSFGYRCHFRAFQLELDTLDTQNIGNGPVVAKLQPFGVGKISEISGKSELSSASTRIRSNYWRSVFIYFWDSQKVSTFFW